MCMLKRGGGTGRQLIGMGKGLAIPWDFCHQLQGAYDSRNRVAFLLSSWLVCLHSVLLLFTPPGLSL